MRSLVFSLLLLVQTLHLLGLEKLRKEYLIEYGNSCAPVKIVNYFSFHCPHCIALFRSDFDEIKKNYIDTEKVYWVFHPVPTDLLTVQGMDCLEKLTVVQKRIFLEAILEEGMPDDSNLTALLMQKAMEVFGKPISDLQDKSHISASNAFQDAFKFLTQKDKISAVPTIEMDGQLFLEEIPDLNFIKSQLDKRNHEK